MTELPSGTVTFLFTDLEGSTRLWDEHPDAMRPALARHDEIVCDAILVHNGHVVKTTGDGFHAVFANVNDALVAASDAQGRLHEESWGPTGELRVRMGLHTCQVEMRDGDYYGGAVNRAARVMSVAHGGQIVMSATTAELARDATFELRDLGDHRLAGLARPERVSQLCVTGLVQEFPPLRSLDAVPGNLPRQVTSFVGRDDELDTVAALVRSNPLVTLIGVGGVGKTRLALEAAAAVVGDFPDGAWLCELAPLTDPAAVWETLAEALRVLPTPGRLVNEVLLDYLSTKRSLLVLDNCEHLLDAAATVVDAIEQHCRQVVVLATSREGLAVRGEQLVAVPSLGLPGTDAETDSVESAESVRLFCDRARSATSDFETTGDNLAAIAVLCRRLDGIPLAIELAAARVRSLTPEDLVARLDQRFKLLARGGRASLERHQTLRNTIDWSYDLLDTPERVAVQRMSVFAGGADLAAAEGVLSGDDLDAFDVIDVVGQLVDKSLVIADADENGRLRYRMFESIRQYAQERLEASGNAAGVRARHADHYVALAEVAGPRLRSRDQLEWARRMVRETDNFRVALDWAVDTGSPDTALRLVAPLAVNGMAIGHSALDWAETAVDMPGAEADPRFPDVASWATWSATGRNDLDRADAYAARLEQAQTVHGTRSASARQGPATVAFFRGDFDGARRRAEEWVSLARSSGSPYELAHALTMLTTAQRLTGDDELARASGEEAVQIARAAAIPSALSTSLLALVQTVPHGEPERSRAILDEAIRVGTEIGNRVAVANATEMQGAVAAYHGDYPVALPAAAHAAAQKLELGELTTLGGTFDVAALSLAGLGHAEPAVVLRGAVTALGNPGASPQWRERIADIDAALIEQLGRTRFETLRAEGTALTPRDAVEYLVNVVATTPNASG